MTALLRGTLRHNTKPIHWMSSVRAMPRKRFAFSSKEEAAAERCILRDGEMTLRE